MVDGHLSDERLGLLSFIFNNDTIKYHFVTSQSALRPDEGTTHPSSARCAFFFLMFCNGNLARLCRLSQGLKISCLILSQRSFRRRNASASRGTLPPLSALKSPSPLAWPPSVSQRSSQTSGAQPFKPRLLQPSKGGDGGGNDSHTEVAAANLRINALTSALRLIRQNHPLCLVPGPPSHPNQEVHLRPRLGPQETGWVYT